MDGPCDSSARRFAIASVHPLRKLSGIKANSHCTYRLSDLGSRNVNTTGRAMAGWVSVLAVSLFW